MGSQVTTHPGQVPGGRTFMDLLLDAANVVIGPPSPDISSLKPIPPRALKILERSWNDIENSRAGIDSSIAQKYGADESNPPLKKAVEAIRTMYYNDFFKLEELDQQHFRAYSYLKQKQNDPSNAALEEKYKKLSDMICEMQIALIVHNNLALNSLMARNYGMDSEELLKDGQQDRDGLDRGNAKNLLGSIINNCVMSFQNVAGMRKVVPKEFDLKNKSPSTEEAIKFELHKTRRPAGTRDTYYKELWREIGANAELLSKIPPASRPKTARFVRSKAPTAQMELDRVADGLITDAIKGAIARADTPQKLEELMVSPDSMQSHVRESLKGVIGNATESSLAAYPQTIVQNGMW